MVPINQTKLPTLSLLNTNAFMELLHDYLSSEFPCLLTKIINKLAIKALTTLYIILTTPLYKMNPI